MRLRFGKKKCRNGRRERSRGTDMAHRKSLTAGGLATALAGGVTAAVLLAGAVFLSNEATNMRANIAQLENRKCCLEAGNAHLQADWNGATAPEVIISRACRAGLEVPTEPALVLVQADPSGRDAGRPWRHLLDHLGGGAEAQAVGYPASTENSGLVSLLPRTAVGTGR